jgi:uncharacterized protein (DUF1015 family)
MAEGNASVGIHPHIAGVGAAVVEGGGHRKTTAAQVVRRRQRQQQETGYATHQKSAFHDFAIEMEVKHEGVERIQAINIARNTAAMIRC